MSEWAHVFCRALVSAVFGMSLRLVQLWWVYSGPACRVHCRLGSSVPTTFQGRRGQSLGKVFIDLVQGFAACEGTLSRLGSACFGRTWPFRALACPFFYPNAGAQF